MFEVNTFDPKTLVWWFDERDNIDFSPPYQRRGNIWSEFDKQFLIDSILNGFDVPKIYIADFSFGNSDLNESGRQFAIIDGKQRLSAIFDFLDGRLLLNRSFIWARDPDLRLGGLSYKDLLANHPKVASKFANSSLTVMRVITDDDTKINELFVRLNKGKSLTGAELRNAMGGEVTNLIRDIANHQFFSRTIAFTTNRRQSDNVAAKLLLLEFRGNFVDTKKVHLDRFVEEGRRAEAQTAEFNQAKDRCIKVLDQMHHLFSQRDPLLRSQGPITVYYWLVRKTPHDRLPLLRQFLVEFDVDRKRNKLVVKADPASSDPELSNFDLLDRSTNDQGSISARYEILRRRFSAWAP